MWFKIVIQGLEYYVQASDKEEALEIAKSRMQGMTGGAGMFGGTGSFLEPPVEGQPEAGISITIDDLAPIEKLPPNTGESRIINTFGGPRISFGGVGVGGNVGPQAAWEVEEERAPYGKYQRGFLEGLGRDPDQYISDVFRRYFQRTQGTGQAVGAFRELMDPAFEEEAGYQAPTIGEQAANLARTGGSVYETARNIWSELLKRGTAGVDPTQVGTGSRIAPYLGSLTGMDETTREERDRLLNLARGAALDKYGTALGSRLIPDRRALGAFETASPEARETGFLKFLQDRFGL